MLPTKRPGSISLAFLRSLLHLMYLMTTSIMNTAVTVSQTAGRISLPVTAAGVLIFPFMRPAAVSGETALFPPAEGSSFIASTESSIGIMLNMDRDDSMEKGHKSLTAAIPQRKQRYFFGIFFISDLKISTMSITVLPVRVILRMVSKKAFIRSRLLLIFSAVAVDKIYQFICFFIR